MGKRRIVKFIRLYPMIVLTALALTFGLSSRDSTGHRQFSQTALTALLVLFVGVFPLAVIIGFIFVGQLGNTQFNFKQQSKHIFKYTNPFSLPVENMHGYKIALITGRIPTFTGLTGDDYLTDASATCTYDANHVPPVADCQCGFYAFKDLPSAKFELSLNPGTFLLDIDLYGIGFVYEGGYRAEQQVVKQLHVPKRCMRCKVLPTKVFVTTFKLGFSNDTWWQWAVRCKMCSSTFKAEDKLSILQMGAALNVNIETNKHYLDTK